MEWRAPEYPVEDGAFVGAERTVLEGMLDWSRAGFLSRCSGLTGEQLVMRPVPPSNLSLVGLVRHLTDVERNWFRVRFGGEHLALLHRRPDGTHAAFEDLNPELAATDLEGLVAEQAAARRAVSGLPLDATYVSERWGTMSLRWAYSHLLAEYAGHTGHADLMCERIDGKTLASR